MQSTHNLARHHMHGELPAVLVARAVEPGTGHLHRAWLGTGAHVDLLFRRSRAEEVRFARWSIDVPEILAVRSGVFQAACRQLAGIAGSYSMSQLHRTLSAQEGSFSPFQMRARKGFHESISNSSTTLAAPTPLPVA